MYKNKINNRLNRERLSRLLIVLCAIGTISMPAYSQELVESVPLSDLYQTSLLPAEHVYTASRFSLIGTPKYTDNFRHFDYVNPNAPKGGTLRLAVIGNFDNFNRLASRGIAERSSDELYETLFTSSDDELNSYYPLVATAITYSDRYQWAEVSINPKARFSDGLPITAKDVEFSFNKMMTQGVPQYRLYYQGVTVKALDLYRVRFELPEPNRERLLNFIGNFRVLVLE